jgi:hypothetical protein
MALTKAQKKKVITHSSYMAYIGAVIVIVWAITAIMKARGM